MSRRIVIPALWILIGCGGSLQLGEMQLVEKSADKPGWAKETADTFTKDEVVYFRSLITDRKDLAFAMREAKAEAVKNVVEGLKARIETEFIGATEGNNVEGETLSRVTTDAIGWVTNNLNVQGLSASESYWERYKKRTNTGIEYYYSVYALVQMSEQDYQDNRNRALQEIDSSYRAKNDKSAQETVGAIRKRLSAGE